MRFGSEDGLAGERGGDVCSYSSSRRAMDRYAVPDSLRAGKSSQGAEGKRYNEIGVQAPVTLNVTRALSNTRQADVADEEMTRIHV